MDTASGERYVPHVIEPAAGLGRTVLTLLCDAYDEDEIGGEQRTVLRLMPKMAPIKVAVLPLVNKEGQPERAREIYEQLRELMPAEFDTGGSIGKRYRRQDEIGTPWGVTVDHQTMEDGTVTLRDRDTLEQVRVPAGELRPSSSAGSAPERLPGGRYSEAPSRRRAVPRRARRRPAVPVRVGEDLDAEAVAEREQDRGHRLGSASRLITPSLSLRRSPLREVGAPAAGRARPSRRGSPRCGATRSAARRAPTGCARSSSMNSSRPTTSAATIASLVLRLGEPLVHRLVAHLAVLANDLDEQPLLGAEVVVEQPARDAGLARHVVEGRAGCAARADARAHGGDDPLRLLALEPLGASC